MNVLVVDDEPVARRRLTRMLKRMDGITVVREAEDGDSALAQVLETQPDVLLLDIRMPGETGLELASRIPEGTHVIFVTAYEEYAVQAFDASAADYLLKPVEVDRLAVALEKVRRLRAPQDRTSLEELLRRVTGRDDPPRVTARSGETLRVFDPREIVRFHAEGGYTTCRHGGRSYLLNDSIASLEDLLREWGFARIHRSELVNLSGVRALHREDDSVVVELSDGQRAPVSRRYLPAFKKSLGIAGK
jgi:DNA-binding LytR/AlgR family response regulator